ncbi:MAG TPA: peptidylprolyl isomerase [Bryobacteraceae bacterium]|jgi:peptidyl-prolyl cis-trans isomerase D
MFDLFRSREKAMKYLLTAVLSVVALSMVITLVPGITNPVATTNEGENVIAHVCDATVTQDDVRIQVDKVTQGGRLPPQMVSSYLPVIIDNLVQNLGLACAASEKGLDISDQDLAEEIRNEMPNLVNAKGEFDKRSYEMGVQRMGMTVPLFEERLKQQILVKRMTDLATEGIFVAPSDVRKEYERRNVKIKLEYASVTAASLAGKIKPEESDLIAFFNSAPNKYKIPAKREYTVIYADQEKIGSTLTVGDDQLRAAYNRDIDRFRLPERVKVRHILILTQGLNDEQKKAALDKIKGILKRVKAGEDFGKLAKEYSEDPGSKNNGGEYDYKARGEWVKPFEDAAFSMKNGQISDIVTTDYGYHIIQTLDHQEARVKPFDEVKGTLATEVQHVQVQDAMQKAIDAGRAEIVKNPGQLDQIAAKYHLDVVKSPGMVTATQPMPVLGKATELINAIFTLKKGDFTNVTQPEASKLAFARVDGVEDARPAKFEEVRPQVVTQYLQFKTDEVARTKVQEAAAKLKAGDSFKDVAKFLGAEPKTSEEVGRDGAIEGIGDANAFSELFAKPVGSVVGPISLMGQYIVAKSVDKKEPPADEFEAKRPEIVDGLKQKVAQERFLLFKDSVMQHLLDKGKIKRNQKAIDALVQSYIRNG